MTGPGTRSGAQPVEGVELAIARLLLAGTVLGMAFIAIGVVLMAVNDVSPIAETFPPFDAGRLAADLGALRPEGFLWAGLIVVIATPIARVGGELLAFALRGDTRMSLVALAILLVVGGSVAAALLLGS